MSFNINGEFEVTVYLLPLLGLLFISLLVTSPWWVQAAIVICCIRVSRTGGGCHATIW